jgi:predicted DCC family thiol-disulfide oxidoreductase YuxK
MMNQQEEQTDHRPLLIFDGECGFCRAWVGYWNALSGERVQYAPYQEVGEQFPQISREEFSSAARLIMPDGEVRSGAHAAFTALAFAPGKRWMLWTYENVPGVSALTEAAYRVIARHRTIGLQVTRLLWGVPVLPETYRGTSWLFLRLLGAIYLVAFWSFGVQAAGLIGSRGILPVADFLRGVHQYLGAGAFWNVPTLLWFGKSDAALRVIWIAGVCLSLLLVFGVNSRLVRLGLFVLYLSLDSAGQIFMSYQWDALLLETGFLAVFLGSEVVIVRLFRWLLCRLMFLSGAVKLASGDPTWRNFSALPVHYQTQPLPTPLAWYFYQLPGWFQRLSVGFLFFVELAVPFLVLAPRRIRHFAAFAIMLLQVLILLTGNYAFFNFLTISLCLFAFDDAALARALPRRIMDRLTSRTGSETATLKWSLGGVPLVWKAVCTAVASLILFTSGFEMIGELSGRHSRPADLVIRAVAPFEIVNTYGLFAVMTTSRPEIIIEGSNDGVNWLVYEFKYKPGDLSRRPPVAEPHQPRLDWQMWFAALGNYRTDPWIIQFLERLLEGSPPVLTLLEHNPFPASPPRYIRAQLYEYSFTTPAERRATGDWWHREWKGTYVPEVSLR